MKNRAPDYVYQTEQLYDLMDNPRLLKLQQFEENVCGVCHALCISVQCQKCKRFICDGCSRFVFKRKKSRMRVFDAVCPCGGALYQDFC